MLSLQTISYCHLPLRRSMRCVPYVACYKSNRRARSPCTAKYYTAYDRDNPDGFLCLDCIRGFHSACCSMQMAKAYLHGGGKQLQLFTCRVSSYRCLPLHGDDDRKSGTGPQKQITHRRSDGKKHYLNSSLCRLCARWFHKKQYRDINGNAGRPRKKLNYPIRHKTLNQCWLNVVPTLNQHWINVLCLLGCIAISTNPLPWLQ